MIERFDVAIVGGGPAGLSAAIAAAEKGCRSVAVVERKRQWGRPVQCAEMAPKLLGQIVPLDRSATVQAVGELHFWLDFKPVGRLHAPAWMLDRPRWEAALAGHAAALGVALFHPATVLAMSGNGLLLSYGGVWREIEARIIIGADGPQSLVRRLRIETPIEFALAVQEVLPLTQGSEAADLFFSPDYGSGYGWCFPRGGEANIGLALPWERRRRLRELFRRLTDYLQREGRIASVRPIRRSGGLIPVGGPVAQTVFAAADKEAAAMLLAGDAAGQCHPLSGAGILTACACGRLAGEVAARAMTEKSPAGLAEYETAWRDLYGGYLHRGLKGRQKIMAADPEQFATVLQDVWRFRSL
ncbi:MAG: NAD(P)/FAD-dependent oxidoreductase [Candidatus Sumerlaeia bacterium]|nr:NAD(P)/FAD-dependent oxidoreductase [Candidatus Sumerlaeia bacterium]